MLQNFVQTALRNFRRNGLYTALNLAGLTVGFAGFILLGLYIADELRFDALHSAADRIFRIVEERTDADGKTTRVAATSYLLAERGKQDLPEIAETVKIGATGRSNVFVSDPNQAVHERIWHADPSFGQVFDFPWVSGDRRTAFTQPFSVVITREFARRMFGTDQVLGKALNIDGFRQPVTVTGVLEDFPPNSSIHFNLAVSTSTFDEMDFMKQMKAGDWTSNNFPTWVLLQPDADAAQVTGKLNALAAANLPPDQAGKRHYSLLPLRDIHFKGAGIEGLSDRMANPAYITVLSLVALFLLGIACINYINLTTARASGRGKEVGVRKVSGAGQGQMVGQFLTETYLLVAGAFLLSVVLLQFLLPVFNAFTEKTLRLNTATDPAIWAAVIGTALLVGLLAGLYPAFYLARLRPTALFKNLLPGSRWEFSLRKALVVAQFALSALLMIATGVVWCQMRFLENKDLGFTRDPLVVVDINSGRVRRGFEPIKTAYGQVPGVKAVSVTSRVPGEWKNIPNVMVHRTGTGANAELKTAALIGADEDFLHAFDVPLLAGRNFASNNLADSMAVLLNESAAASLGIAEPSGQWLEIPAVAFAGNPENLEQPYKVQVIGIVRDFHYRSLREKIGPLILANHRNPIHAIDYFTVRVDAANAAAVLPRLDAILRQTDPGHQFEWHYLDDQWALFYRDDVRRQKILTASATGAIFIACLGLFGLATFAAERRRKEIGIRKVLGASMARITGLLSQDFLKLVALAILIATPLAYYLMNQWLADFAYRIALQWWMFAGAGLAALTVAFLTVSFQSVKAARTNPVQALRSE